MEFEDFVTCEDEVVMNYQTDSDILQSVLSSEIQENQI